MSLSEPGRAFEGVRILDFTHVLAGPFCTCQLGLLGAEVIKIEAPDWGDYMRGRGADEALRDTLMGDQFACQNANKRSLAIDLRHPEAAPVVRRLVRDADVVVENFRPGVLARLGFGYDALAGERLDLIWCSLSGYGQDGPMAHHPAYDNVIQAVSGLMAATRTAASGPLKAGAPVVDYASGTMAAFAVAAALFRRERTGCGQRIDLAMLDVALLLMSPLVTSLLRTGRSPAPHGNAHALAGASCYEAADGELIMLGACNQREFERLCACLERPDLLADPRFREVRRQDPHRDPLARELARTLRTRPAAAWEARLAGVVPVARVRRLAEALALPQLACRRVIARLDEEAGPLAGMAVPLAAFSCDADGPALERPPPALGADGGAILAEAGYDAAEIDTLVAKGVIARRP